MALSVQTADALKPRATRYEVPDGRVRGLFLIVQPSGAKSWCIRYRHGGRTRKLVLGPFGPGGLDLLRARAMASERLLQVHAGRDPAGEKAAAKQGDTLRAVADRYITEHLRPHVSVGHAEETERVFKMLILPRLGSRALSEIRPADVLALMNAQTARGFPLVGNRVFIVLRAFFAWCKRVLLIQDSPCAGLRKLTPEKPRDRVLTDDELRRLWRACETIGYPFGPLVRLLMLTGARRQEVAGITWTEVDLDAATWTLPGSRTKNGREHVVHLSEPALAVLRSVPVIAGRDLLFSTTGATPVSGFSRVKRMLDKTMGHPPAWVIHDIRRTVVSGMARLGVQIAVAERAVNHVSGTLGGLVAVYQKHQFFEERRAAFDVWAAHLVTLLDARDGTK